VIKLVCPIEKSVSKNSTPKAPKGSELDERFASKTLRQGYHLQAFTASVHWKQQKLMMHHRKVRYWGRRCDD